MSYIDDNYKKIYDNSNFKEYFIAYILKPNSKNNHCYIKYDKKNDMFLIKDLVNSNGKRLTYGKLYPELDPYSYFIFKKAYLKVKINEFMSKPNI